MRHRKAILTLVAATLLGLLAWGGSGATSPEPADSCSDLSTTGLYTAAEGQEMMASTAQCYFVGISRFLSYCSACSDLYVLRYLCHSPAKGWYYANYAYCMSSSKGGLNHGTTTGEYSYRGGSNCGSNADRVDPITVVFYGGDYTDVQKHACDHGSWCFNSGGAQRFWTYGCYDQDGNANSANPNLTQYHMRILTGRYWDGTYDCDSTWGRYNVATPHHEKWVMPQVGCGSGWHSVYDNTDYPPGGFVEAREDILDNWVWNGPHKWGGEYYWGNTAHFKQSAGKGWVNGCWYAWSDGWVDYISLDHR